jgi:hypothetical protein
MITVNSIVHYWQTHAGVRFAATLFSVLLVAQAIWIYPALQRFEQDELKRLSYTGLATMESLLTLASTNINPEEVKLLGETLSNNTPLKGARIYNYDGELIMSFGEAPIYEPYQLSQTWGHWMTDRLEQGSRVEMSWLPQDSYSPYLIVARLDSSHVQHSLDQFLGFLLTMVFTVTFITTLSFMWIMRKPSLRTWVEKVTGIEELKPSKVR